MVNVARAAPLNDIPNHGQLAVIVLDTPVLLFRHDDKVFALDDVCTHTGDALAGGEVDGFVVTCPWHGAQFDIRTGKNLRMPALWSIRDFCGSGRILHEGEHPCTKPISTNRSWDSLRLGS